MSTTTNTANVTMSPEEFEKFFKVNYPEAYGSIHFTETDKKTGSVNHDVPVEKTLMTKAFEMIDDWWSKYPATGFVIFAGLISIGSYALCKHLLTGSIYKANVKTIKYLYKLG